MKKLVFQSSVLLLLLALMSTGHADPQQTQVKCDQGDSIQDAVNSVDEDGAVIRVFGTCNEQVVIRKDRLRISGVNNPTILPSPGGTAFTVLADHVEISGFNIIGGESAFVIEKGSSATITNNRMLDYTGDGIFIAGSSSGSIQDNFLSSTIANRSAIFVVGTASALIDDNTIGASSASGILISAASSALVGCNNISVSDPLFGGIFVGQLAHLSLGACANTISNSDPGGSAIFCSKSSSIFAEAAQIITAGAIVLHPDCDVFAIPGVTFP